MIYKETLICATVLYFCLTNRQLGLRIEIVCGLALLSKNVQLRKFKYDKDKK